MHRDGRLTTWGTWLGAAALTVVPLAHVDGINRFVLLPQVAVLLALMLFGLGAWLYLGKGRYPLHSVAIVALAFLFLQVVSAAVSAKPALSLLPLAIEAGCIFLFLFLLVSLTPLSCAQIASVAALGAVVVSVIGLAQVFSDLSFIPSSAQPSSTLGHRNLAAAYVVSVVPYLLGQAFGSRRPRASLIWWLGVGIAFAFILATRSRGAWVGCVAAAGVGLFAVALGRVKMPSFRLIGAGVGTATLVVLLSLTAPTSSPPEGEAMWHEKAALADAARSMVDEGGDKGRLVLWHRTLEMIANRPIIGVGPGHWRIVYPAYAEGDMIDSQAAPIRPHNDWLAIWSESGIVALALLVSIVILASRDGWLRIGQHPTTLAALCSVAATVVSGLFGFNREFPATWLPFWVGISLLLTASGRVKIRRNGLAPMWLVPGLVLAALGLIFVYQSVQFDRFHLRARTAIALKDWPSAEFEATNALALGVYNEELFLLRGRSRESLGRPAEAVRDYRAGLAWAPYDIGSWIGLGNGYRAQGDTQRAFESYQAAYAIDPFDARIHNNLGSLHAAAGRLDSALVWFERASKSKSRTSDVFGNLSAAYRRKGAVGRAVEMAESGLRRDSSHVGLWNALGSAVLADGDTDRALDAYRRALHIDPTLIQPRFNLARAHEAAGFKDSALTAYRQVLQLSDTQDDPRIDFVRLRIEALSP